MADWYVRIVGKRKQEVDKHLLVQAVLAMARLLDKRQRLKRESETADNAAQLGPSKPGDSS